MEQESNQRESSCTRSNCRESEQPAGTDLNPNSISYIDLKLPRDLHALLAFHWSHPTPMHCLFSGNRFDFIYGRMYLSKASTGFIVGRGHILHNSPVGVFGVEERFLRGGVLRFVTDVFFLSSIHQFFVFGLFVCFLLVCWSCKRLNDRNERNWDTFELNFPSLWLFCGVECFPGPVEMAMFPGDDI